jgi:hypothetical protein
MKLNAYIFIFTALIYNFIDLGNREFQFVSKKFLDDIWYCSIYAHVTFLYFSAINKTSHKVINFAFRVAIGRFLYNFLILINLIEHTPYKATLFVPCFIVFLALYEKYGWELSLLKRWVHGFITRFF